MPAPQSSVMKQLARAKFSSFNLQVPENWTQPTGDPDAQHYAEAFKPEEKTSTPDPTVPPLFRPYTLNKYHTDVQKDLTATVGGFMDGIIDSICSAWGTWQSSAVLTSVVINAVIAVGGQVVGMPLTPLILAQGPKSKPAEMKYTNTVATVVGTAWASYTATIKVPGLPWYPAFATVPSPVAPPTPNIPCPVIALTQAANLVSASTLKNLMVAQHGDPTAQYSNQIFEAISDAFEKCFLVWQTSTMVTNVLGTGPVPSFAPPVAPMGPVVMGMGNMTPGGFT